MRIWHESLIPKLCRQHLLAMWREGLGCISILEHDKQGYRNHPAVKEFENHFSVLCDRIYKVKLEMLKRGYKPHREYIWKASELPLIQQLETYKPWQTLEEQVAILKQKGCECKI